MSVFASEREKELFDELLSRIVNAYESIKHYNPPKGKIITAVIDEMHRTASNYTVPLGPFARARKIRRMADYQAGYTDQELSRRWGINIAAVKCWRHRQGLKPNAKQERSLKHG